MTVKYSMNSYRNDVRWGCKWWTRLREWRRGGRWRVVARSSWWLNCWYYCSRLWWCQQVSGCVITSAWHNLTFRHVLHGSHTIIVVSPPETRQLFVRRESVVGEGQFQNSLFPSYQKNSRKNKSCQSWVICCNKLLSTWGTMFVNDTALPIKTESSSNLEIACWLIKSLSIFK